MLKNGFAGIALASLFSLALGGCYFASGIDYDEPAFRHATTKARNPYVIELRARPWKTGNVHMPFDFTVYRYDETFEVSLPDKTGSFGKNDIGLKACGVPLVVVAAVVEVTRDLIKFDIAYNFQTGGAPKPFHLVGSMRVAEASAAPGICTRPGFHVPSAAAVAG